MLNNSMELREQNGINNLVYILCFLSVLSQMPIINFGSMPEFVWIAFFWYILTLNKTNIPLSSIYFFPIGFYIYVFVMNIIFDHEISTVQVQIKLLTTAFFIFVVGMTAGRFFTQEMFFCIAKSYVVSTLLVSVVVWFTAIRGKTLDAGGYLYGAKNSFASIMLIELAVVVIMKEEFFKSFFQKVVYYLIIAYNIYMLLYLKSRTTLLALLVLMAVYILFSEIKLSSKIIFIGLIIAAAIFIMKNEAAYDLIINNIWLKGKEIDDVNGITSGRMSHFEIFKMYFPKHPWIGSGRYWVESFPLCTLLVFGIFGCSFLFSFVISPLIIGIICYIRTPYKKMATVLIAASISLLVNSFGESPTPLGPGVKCFIMWFLAGICNYVMLYKNDRVQVNERILETEGA